MDERRLESMSETAQSNARRLAGEAQDVATRAGAYMQERARDVGEQVERLTGRPMESWMRETRRYVQDHPLQAVALTIGLGFVLGKILSRD